MLCVATLERSPVKTTGKKYVFDANRFLQPAEPTRSTYCSSESLTHRWYSRRHVRQPLRDGGENRSLEAANLRGFAFWPNANFPTFLPGVKKPAEAGLSET